MLDRDLYTCTTRYEYFLGYPRSPVFYRHAACTHVHSVYAVRRVRHAYHTLIRPEINKSNTIVLRFRSACRYRKYVHYIGFTRFFRLSRLHVSRVYEKSAVHSPSPRTVYLTQRENVFFSVVVKICHDLYIRYSGRLKTPLKRTSSTGGDVSVGNPS